MRFAVPAATAALALIVGGLGGLAAPTLLTGSDTAVAGSKTAATPPTPDTTGSQAPRLVGEPWARTELYFGTARPDGSAVTEEQFRRFVNEQITPRFPDGVTFLSGQGQFRGADGQLVRERSMLVILLYPPDARDSNRKIRDIRASYERTFQQESVLRVDAVERVSFDP